MWLVRSPDGLRDMYVMAVLSPLPAGMTLQSKRIDAVVAQYRTVAGSRLVNDTAIAATNARRVLAHPYLSTLEDA